MGIYVVSRGERNRSFVSSGARVFSDNTEIIPLPSQGRAETAPTAVEALDHSTNLGHEPLEDDENPPMEKPHKPRCTRVCVGCEGTKESSK